MSFKVEIVADSVSSIYGNRITSMLCTFPRFILAEMNTHRMFSRNSASSRAIPFKKMVEMVKTHPFIPIRWMKEHTGMQGTEYFGAPHDEEEITAWWLGARDKAVAFASDLSQMGVSKQMCNRLLEPFMWHTALITATEWENFFALRVHEAAEIHMQKIATMMLEAYNESKPKVLQSGEWHVPFGDHIDLNKLDKATIDPKNYQVADLIKNPIKVATARCARVSYTTMDGDVAGKDDYAADIKLHDRLAASGHWSPFEHCARAMNLDEHLRWFKSVDYKKGYNAITQDGWCKNFRGFVQYRATFENENKSDSRVIQQVVLKPKD